MLNSMTVSQQGEYYYGIKRICETADLNYKVLYKNDVMAT